MKWVLKVSYRNNDTQEIEEREYDYNGQTDKTKIEWLDYAEEIAFDNCKSNEDVMNYKLIEKEI